MSTTTIAYAYAAGSPAPVALVLPHAGANRLGREVFFNRALRRAARFGSPASRAAAWATIDAMIADAARAEVLP